MNSNKFRKELIKIMPGYKWTVHRDRQNGQLSATGIKSSGFNRLSTLEVTRRDRDVVVVYFVRSSGFGTRAPWLGEYKSTTLAQALRGLQDHYEAMWQTYSGHAGALRVGRKEPE